MVEENLLDLARRLAMTVMVGAMLGLTVTACGGDPEPAGSQGGQAQSNTRTDSAATTAERGTTFKQITDTPEDGRLTTPSGKVITDGGDRSQRIAAVQALDRLQHDFRAGRMAAACTRISDFLLSQFTPPGAQRDTPCPKKLEAYARQRARRADRPQQMKLLWVRHYTGQAGVWVEEAGGKRLRIQLSYPLSADGWELDLGAHKRPDLLAAELVGADEYGQR